VRTNPVKKALKAGQTVFGSEISRLASPEICRLYALAGFDFVFIDMEHTPFGLETVAAMISSARTAGIVPIVRVPQAEYAFICRLLDQGAQGIIVPRVNTAEQVRDIVSWMRYPPQGIRGFAGTVAQTDFENVSAAEFIESNNRETLCIIQFERQQAVDNVAEMLAVPGVDVACLGVMDLSVDLGLPGQLDHPQMIAALERIVAVAERSGVAAGIVSGDMQLTLDWMRKGMRFVSYAQESQFLREAATMAVERLRAAHQKPKGGG
jgi:2-keto-3-deoxy-L-rhamnonate aldolase RhmA